MAQTSWRDDFTRVVKNRAIAYSESGGTYSLDMPFENVHGQGGLLTTVGDLLRWTGNFSRPVVGGADFVKEMLVPGRFSDGRPHDYALGLRVSTYQGLREVSHSGATAGYRAWLSEYPDRQLAVAVLCNAANANATQYARAVAELYLGLTPPTTNASNGVTPATGLDGLYRRSDTGAPLRVSRVGSDLQANGGRLTAQSPSLFKAANGTAYEFAPGALTVTDTFGTIDRYALLKGEQLNTRPLESYAGTYDCVDAETILTAAAVDGALVLRRRPDAVIRLTPVYADAFQSSLGLVRFHRNGASAIVSLGISDERVWDLRCGKK
jgi:CubicO group peptidase (beta-lactamase class C family)